MAFHDFSLKRKVIRWLIHIETYKEIPTKRHKYPLKTCIYSGGPGPAGAVGPSDAPRHGVGILDDGGWSLEILEILDVLCRQVTRRLDDWAEVTRGGIADLRSEIGAVTLEQRFAQTLRSGAAATPLVGSAAASPMGRGEDVAGEELKKRLEVYEKKLSAAWRGDLGPWEL